MAELLTSIGKLAIGFLGIAGPVAFLIICLRVRDQRESMLYAIVLAELNRHHLRGLHTVRVKFRLLWTDTVVIDLWNCSREQVCHVVERLSVRVPPRVRVEVNGISDCRIEFSGENKAVFNRCCAIS
ncbi:hypothetical protein ANRL2_04430 [Anaerolineae bacterium]|nr:hypothetical protein ANRL2_04430 [Anaerolineae bacterium]